MYFDGFWLIAHNVLSSDDEELNRLLLMEYKPVKEAIDKEDVSKSFILCATRRKDIVEVKLDTDSTLHLTFENGVTLSFPTNTDVVDWQWAINEKGNDPYLGFIVACFSPGEVQTKSCQPDA